MGNRVKNLIKAGAVIMALITLSGEPARGETVGATMPEYLVAKDVPRALQEMVSEGRLSEAEAWLEESIKTNPNPMLQTERERLTRLRREFSSTPEEMFAKLKRSLPDLTQEQFDKWRDERAIQWIPVDGEVRFFRREPGNLFRFNDEARKLREAHGQETVLGDSTAQNTDNFSLDEAFAKALAAAKAEGKQEVLPVRFHMKHTITVNPGIVPPGETIRVWVPVPRDYRHQEAGRIISTEPAEHRLSNDQAAQRTVYFEKPAAAEGEPTVFDVEYEYVASTFVSGIRTDREVPPIAEKAKAQDLQEQPPHIVFTPKVKELAAKIVGDETDPLRKAEKIFEYMDANVKWAAEMEYCVMPRIVDKIIAEGRGDCGVQALMLISLLRTSGIPARWQSGWVVRPNYWNLHDWAEFYVEPYGWLPADPSMGFRKSEDEGVKRFLFGNIDAYRMIANLDQGTEFDPPKEHWRSDPVDSQRGEVEWKGGNLYYDDWAYDVKTISIK